MKESKLIQDLKKELREVSLLLAAIREDHPLYHHVKSQKTKLEWQIEHEEKKKHGKK